MEITNSVLLNTLHGEICIDVDSIVAFCEYDDEKTPTRVHIEGDIFYITEPMDAVTRKILEVNGRKLWARNQ